MRRLGVFALLFLLVAPAQARDLQMISKNNRAVKLFKHEKRQEALDQFIGLTATNPSDLQLKFNMATSLHALGDEEKAIKLYLPLLKIIDELIEKTQGSEASAEVLAPYGGLDQQQLFTLRFATLYNLGVAYQFMQNNDEALKYYQKALELSPDSKEIKINIELMFAGGGGGKGKDKDKDKQKGEGEGEGEGDPEDQDGDQEQKDKEQSQSDKQKEQEQKQKKQPKEFDQKYMSKEDLQRIMEELNGQEQKIRAKMERKGGKSAPKDKEW